MGGNIEGAIFGAIVGGAVVVGWILTRIEEHLRGIAVTLGAIREEQARSAERAVHAGLDDDEWLD